MEKKNPLTAPAAHSVSTLLRELKWGRPGHQQDFLLGLANDLESDNPNPEFVALCKKYCPDSNI